jgi:hypothetical protein
MHAGQASPSTLGIYSNVCSQQMWHWVPIVFIFNTWLYSVLSGPNGHRDSLISCSLQGKGRRCGRGVLKTCMSMLPFSIREQGPAGL